jgi:hypothetical protein
MGCTLPTDKDFTTVFEPNEGDTSGRRYNAAGLLPGQFYCFRIRAQNAVGMSEWSESSAITLAAGEPAAPPPVNPEPLDAWMYVTCRSYKGR